ncbi:CPBP family intramembrane glutamic endopeptidase [Nocardia sp. NPDC058058]|uniref:CPBP family intramembrane glutamic endopeptidase n=1 Tax=Nocardia sp. NPDC058058 TaxID=3346317 RepID=UPI0036DAD6F3
MIEHSPSAGIQPASARTVHPGAAAAAEPSAFRRRGVSWFLFLAFAGAWLPWLGVRLAGGSMDDPVTQLVTAAFVPALAACVVRRWITRQGFANSGLRLDLRRVWRHVVLAITLPWGALAVAVSVAVTVGWSPSDLDMDGAAWLYLLAGPLICVVMAPFFWGEEYGWTAYLRDRLVPGRPVATTFLTGLIWGVWHWPLPWVGYFGGNTDVLEAVWAMLLWLPLSVLLEFVIGWLWSETRSVWPGAMLHAGSNFVISQGLHLILGDSFGTNGLLLLLCAGLTPFVIAIIASGHTGRVSSNQCHADRGLRS